MISLPFLISFPSLHDSLLKIVITNSKYYSIIIEKSQVVMTG